MSVIMKISAVLTLLCVGYAAGAVKTIQKTAQLLSGTSAAVPRAAVLPGPFSVPAGVSAATSGSQTIQTADSSNTNLVGATVTHGSTTHQNSGTQIYPTLPDDASYHPDFPQPYPGYLIGAYPGFNGGAHHSYFKWAYPGLSGAFYPGFFHVTRRGFLSPLYPGLMEASYPDLVGGSYSRYLSGLHRGLFGGAYESLYGSRFFGYGALKRIRTKFAGYLREVAVTVDPLSGLPELVSVPVANRVVTIERLVPFPSPYPVPVPAPYPAQLPVPHPGDSAPASSTTHTGSSATVSRSELVAPALSVPVVVSGQQQQALGRTQSQARVGF